MTTEPSWSNVVNIKPKSELGQQRADTGLVMATNGMFTYFTFLWIVIDKHYNEIYMSILGKTLERKQNWINQSLENMDQQLVAVCWHTSGLSCKVNMAT